MYRSNLDNGMSKSHNIVKQFALLLLNVGYSAGQNGSCCMLVLKTYEELFYLDPVDKECFSKASGIKVNDGVYIVQKVLILTCL